MQDASGSPHAGYELSMLLFESPSVGIVDVETSTYSLLSRGLIHVSVKLLTDDKEE